MEYSNDYLRSVLPDEEIRFEYVPREVEAEVSSWIEADGMEAAFLIAQSTRWTYAIANELRLNQIEVRMREFPLFFLLGSFWPFYTTEVGIGLFDSATEGDGFGLILRAPPFEGVGPTIIADVIFPRLGVKLPLLYRPSSEEDHSLEHPKDRTSAAWARCKDTGQWGVLTAGHHLPTTMGSDVSFTQGQVGKLIRSCHPGVDCAFIETGPPDELSLSTLATRRFAAAGVPVEVELKSGPVSRTVVEVETNRQTIAVNSYSIKFFLDKPLSNGDSGALVRTSFNEAVGIYLGSLRTPLATSGFEGRALNFEQALFALNVTAHR